MLTHHISPTDHPPYPAKVRWWNRLHAHLAGRRDARCGMLFDTDGHLPFTRELAAATHQGQSTVDHWLHNRIEPGDRSIAMILETIADTRRAITRVDEKLDEINSDGAQPGSEEAIRNAREEARLRATRDQQLQRASQAATQLAQLLSDRRHAIDHAHAGADAWETRFHRLAFCHRRGYLRSRRANSEPAPSPAFPTLLRWRGGGDMPLLTPLIDPGAREILAINLTSFNTRRYETTT